MKLHNVKTNIVKKWLESGEKLIFIDVREISEFKSGHIEGAVNFPLSSLVISTQSLVDFLNTQQDKKIILYCAAGVRSVLAAKRISFAGSFKKDLWNLQEGIKSW